MDGDFVRAHGTTLGADNGIGVATIMAILESKTLQHPPLEALFTIDEEAGMTGAKKLDASQLSAKILLNLDTEEDDEVDIGCAGGIDVTAALTYTPEKAANGLHFFKVTLSGLRGGHSGMDIHRGYANANKVLVGLLTEAVVLFDLRIAEAAGGTLRNAIPREAQAVVGVADPSAFTDWIQTQAAALIQQFKATEKNLTLTAQPTERAAFVPLETQQSWLAALEEAHNGVYRMDTHFPDLVETSNNVAKVSLMNGKASVECLTRSSSETAKKGLAQTLCNTFQKYGFAVQTGNEYPGWQPEADAEILKKYTALYKDFYGQLPKVVACHAGLECGLLKEKMPQTQMISFGPNISGAHSPDECVQISSVQKFWRLLVALLEKI